MSQSTLFYSSDSRHLKTKPVMDHEMNCMFDGFGIDPPLKLSYDVQVQPLYNLSKEAIIREYFDNSKLKQMEVDQIWETTYSKSFIRFYTKGYHRKKNYLLWHGTKRCNLVSILQNGLRLPEPNTHKWHFGPGIYLADRAALSSLFTDRSGAEVFLLCQTAVGNM